MLDQNLKKCDYAQIQKLLAPLGKVCPTIHAELMEAVDRQYEIGRLGDILAAEVDKLIEQVRNEQIG